MKPPKTNETALKPTTPPPPPSAADDTDAAADDDDATPAAVATATVKRPLGMSCNRVSKQCRHKETAAAVASRGGAATAAAAAGRRQGLGHLRQLRARRQQGQGRPETDIPTLRKE